ncbi:MAG: FkbM family methyltransferase [Gammaproteobacteria bacterium]|nr:FkbM family methyltransferase [Gammaproteobacteria bacterium]
MMFDFFDINLQIDKLLEEARHDGITLFGAGGFARAVYSALQKLGVQVHTFVVSGPSAGMIETVPVVSLNELDDALCLLPIWLAVFNRNAASDLVTLARACKARGIDRPRLPQDYFEAIEQQMGWRFWLTDRRQYAGNLPQIEEAFRMLRDDESRQQFMEALRFRLGASIDQAPQPSNTAQYFPDEVNGLVSSRREIVFVDGGAYDGDTIAQAASRLPLATAYAFEPDLANFSRLAHNVKALNFPVVCFPCGLSNVTEWLSFSSQSGEASAVTPDGNTRVQCVRLDECLVGQRVDYIKLDVEGHELAALEGARDIIDRYRPLLAIAPYHRWDDLWRIPKFLQRYAPDYRITYRAHESNTFDSVFYAAC